MKISRVFDTSNISAISLLFWKPFDQVCKILLWIDEACWLLEAPLHACGLNIAPHVLYNSATQLQVRIISFPKNNIYNGFFSTQLFSICLIIIGVWALIERQNTINITSYLDVFTEPSIVLIVVGSVSFILGFTGFLGALRENCCLLMFVSLV